MFFFHGETFQHIKKDKHAMLQETILIHASQYCLYKEHLVGRALSKFHGFRVISRLYEFSAYASYTEHFCSQNYVDDKTKNCFILYFTVKPNVHVYQNLIKLVFSLI